MFIFLPWKKKKSIRKALENRTNMEDDRVAILEAQLAQAKLIAEEADKKYEEVTSKNVLLRPSSKSLALFFVTNALQSFRWRKRRPNPHHCDRLIDSFHSMMFF